MELMFTIGFKFVLNEELHFAPNYNSNEPCIAKKGSECIIEDIDTLDGEFPYKVTITDYDKDWEYFSESDILKYMDVEVITTAINNYLLNNKR